MFLLCLDMSFQMIIVLESNVVVIACTEQAIGLNSVYGPFPVSYSKIPF